MRKYKVKIEPEALGDIQDITNWYNEAQTKLGKRFQDITIAKINRLSKDPQIFAIRYQKTGACRYRNSLAWFISILMKKPISLKY